MRKLRVLAVCLAAAALLPASAAGPARVMVVTGGHAYDTSFDSLFEGSEEISAMVYPRNIAFARDLRQRWDVLVFYDLTQDITDAEKQVLQSFLESGKGLVVLHHALADYPEWAWWYEQVVGGKYFVKAEGSHPMSTYKVGQEITVKPVRKHPVTEGIAEFKLTEETYKGMWISPEVQALLETEHPASDRQVAWIAPYTKSRVVAIQLGHDRKVHLDPSYRKLVRNAVLWAGGQAR